jgi:hypothetical protein
MMGGMMWAPIEMETGYDDMNNESIHMSSDDMDLNIEWTDIDMSTADMDLKITDTSVQINSDDINISINN